MKKLFEKVLNSLSHSCLISLMKYKVGGWIKRQLQLQTTKKCTNNFKYLNNSMNIMLLQCSRMCAYAILCKNRFCDEWMNKIGDWIKEPTYCIYCLDSWISVRHTCIRCETFYLHPLVNKWINQIELKYNILILLKLDFMIFMPIYLWPVVCFM